MNNNIYIILPVYNEGKSIYNLLKKYNDLSQVESMKNLHIVIVNDCSTDLSDKYIRTSMSESELSIKYIKHSKNKGLSGALKTGFDYVKNVGISKDDFLITMDGDDTHNPFLIKKMIEKINEGADIVIASRYLEQSRIQGLDVFRIVLSYGAKFLYRLRWRISGVKDYTCNFRVYRGDVVIRAMNEYGKNFITEKGFTVATEVLRKISRFSKINTEVPMLLRYSDKLEDSNMNILKTVIQTFKMLFR